MPIDTQNETRSRNGKYRRARIRNFLFTVGPNRLSGGKILRRHLSQGVVVRELDITNPRWPVAFDGMRIAHVSDFHLGELLPVDNALAIIEQIAELKPDFVACTGDIVDLHHDPAPPVLRALAQINAPMGSAIVLGNHDELHCPIELARMAERAGLIVLRNEAIQINHNGERLVVGGIDWAPRARQLGRFVERTFGINKGASCDAERTDTAVANLLLAHNPKAFGRAADIGIPLTLAGHTHGGQVALKDRPDRNLAVSHRRSAGIYHRDASSLFVTTGVGAWFPLRVNCPAEIAMITMRRDDVVSAVEIGAAVSEAE